MTKRDACLPAYAHLKEAGKYLGMMIDFLFKDAVKEQIFSL